MRAADRLLVGLLRISGAMTLTALGAVFMPEHWMKVIHQRVGLGELPAAPIVGYLTRSLSAFYALHGALLMVVSRDVHRYLPIVRYLGWAGLSLGLALLLIDRTEGMPSVWTACEGPFVIVLSGVILLLARQVGAGAPGSSPP